MSTDLDNDLEIFRTTWLRTVAFAWSKDEFKNELTSAKDALPVIATVFPELKASNIGKAITLRVRDQPRFVWIGDDWSWPTVPESPEDAEHLTLRIPLEPPTDNPQHTAAAVADYYAMRPSMFAPVDPLGERPAPAGSSAPRNRQPSSASSTRSQSSVASRSTHLKSISALAGSLAPMFGGQRVFSNLTPQDGRLKYGADTFREFTIALTVVIAKAWKNEEFRTLLQTPGILTEALRYARGYAPPWQLRLDVQHDDTAKWSPGSRWTSLTRHELTLSLPARPARDDWSVALAAYNATGADYPFSCCLSTPDPGEYGPSGTTNIGRDVDRR